MCSQQSASDTLINFQIIDLENSIRNHNNRIEDLEVEKLQLESEVVELKRTVKENPIGDQLQAVTSHKNHLEIEVRREKRMK